MAACMHTLEAWIFLVFAENSVCTTNVIMNSQHLQLRALGLHKTSPLNNLSLMRK